ncbi:MAG: L-serine ammonia-lyase, partial [Proteobacteria bacterium]|nr:L-serine ammonia-lyase [Pseudomonadota bacterium]
MFLSIFDIFKIGIGPSSSHTMGPMVAAKRFLEQIQTAKIKPARLGASLHGSLAFTGKGHHSDFAVIMGLAGAQPETFDQKAAALLLEHITDTKTIRPDGHPLYEFDPETAVAFDYDTILPAHSNGMTFFAYDADGKVILEQIFYSIGGGFVQTDAEMT